MYTLSEIHIFPVKSLGGISVPECVVRRRGLQYDRRWMLTDEEGLFVSQREIPELALLGTSIEPPYLVVFQKNNPSERIQIALDMPVADLIASPLQVWDDYFEGFLVPGPASEWFSDQIGQRLQLAFMPENIQRAADARYAPSGQYVSFADGFPFLMIGQAALDALNSRLEQPLPMDRFRPNFVFTGGMPHDEDRWSDIRIGSADFRCVKPCARCVLTTTDQDTAERSPEPIKTLSTYRMQDKKILFGQNVIWTGEGEAAVVRVGDGIGQVF